MATLSTSLRSKTLSTDSTLISYNRLFSGAVSGQQAHSTHIQPGHEDDQSMGSSFVPTSFQPCETGGSFFLDLHSPPANSPKQLACDIDCRVFLSHAGEWERGFVSFLQQDFENRYPLLRVFTDEFPLARGEGALPAIHAAWQDAFVGVLVLSKEFISKPYPMEELHMLLKWRDKGPNKTLIPVFYDISRADVTKKMEAYKAPDAGDPDAELKRRWGQDLRRLLGMTRLRHDQLQEREPTGLELVQQVVSQAAELLAEINELPVSKSEELPELMVPSTDRARVIQLLEIGKAVLLTGMGGIGKTTMAKSLFNELQSRDPTALCHFLRLDPEADEEGLVKKQQELLRALTCAPPASFDNTGDGQQQLVDRLRGKRVLIVIDNVWNDQLRRLLASNFTHVLGQGSMVLVTSRESGAAASFGGEQWVEEVQVGLLSRQDSERLLCWHAGYSSGNLDAEKAALVQLLLDRCAALPMALEVVGKRLRDARLGYLLRPDEAVVYAYKSVRADRLERRRTLVEELRLSWDALGDEEQEALLDIVQFLQGQPWELVRSYCEAGVLERLCDLAFIAGRERSEGERVHVHPVIIDFCKIAIRGCEDQRLDVSADDTGDEPIWEELATEVDARGIRLHGYELDAKGCTALSAMQALRVLVLEGCSIAPALTSEVLPCLSNLRWLQLQGPVAAPSEGTSNLSLQLKGMHRLAVLVLERVHRLERLEGLQDCTVLRTVSIAGCAKLQKLALGHLSALKVLKVADCEGLEHLDLGGMTGLQQLQLTNCKKVQLEAATPESADAPVFLSFEGPRITTTRSADEGFPWPTNTELEASAAVTSPAGELYTGGGVVIPPSSAHTATVLQQELGKAGLETIVEVVIRDRLYAYTLGLSQGCKTALMLAAASWCNAVVVFLPGSGAAVDAADKGGSTPLHMAARKGNWKVVRQLLAAGAAVDARNQAGETPLMLAAWKGHKEVVALLLHSGAAVDAANKGGSTPLHMAAREGNTERVRQLLAAGAVVDAPNQAGETPLMLAAWKGHKEVVALLLGSGAAVHAADKGGRTPLHMAAWQGNEEVVRQLLAAGAVVDATNQAGETPLMLAAWKGHKEVVALLLESGAAVNAANKGGFTPLHRGAREGNEVVVRQLLAAGAAVDAPNQAGETPLILAAGMGHKEVAALLLGSGAAVNAADKGGSTPLHMAPREGNTERVRQLLAAGAAVDAPNQAGETPLMLAAWKGRKEVVALLLGSGAAVNAADKGGRTPLHMAARKGNEEVVRQLLAAGAVVDAPNQAGETPLILAAGMGHKEVVALLLESGAAVNAADKGGITPLHRGAWEGNEEVVRQLLAAGAAVDAPNQGAWTPLHMAARKREVLLLHAELARSSHLHVVSVCGVVHDPDRVQGGSLDGSLVMDWEEGGTLYKWLLDNPDAGQAMRLQLALQVAAGMRHLHMERLVHGDLQPQNVLLQFLPGNQLPEVKICDFGLAKYSAAAITSTWTYTDIAAEFASPERLVGCKPSMQDDVYAFGVLLYFIATSSSPFGAQVHGGAIDPGDLARAVQQGARRRMEEWRQAVGNVAHQSAVGAYCELATQCWQQEPERRPTFQEIFDRLAALADQEPYACKKPPLPPPLPPIERLHPDKSRVSKRVNRPAPRATKAVRVNVTKVDQRALLPTITSQVPASLRVCEGDYEGQTLLLEVPETILECKVRRGHRKPLNYSIRYPCTGAPAINEQTVRWQLSMEAATGKLLVTALTGAAPASVPSPPPPGVPPHVEVPSKVAQPSNAEPAVLPPKRSATDCQEQDDARRLHKRAMHIQDGNNGGA